MQVSLTLNMDLGTAAGREFFARLPQLIPGLDLKLAPQPSQLSQNEVGLGPVNQGQEAAAAAADPDPALTARQQAAAKARAAKAAKAAAEAASDPTSMTDATDLSGPAPSNGQDQAEDLGLSDPSMSPGEARDAGLALMRELYAAGKVAEVKALQKKWQVAKFYDVPVEQGHEFHRQAMQVAQAAGLRT